MASEGFGASLTINGGAIAEVVDISIPGVEGEDIDTTHMLSADGFREFIAGLVDAGEFEVELNFTKAQAATLYGYFRTTHSFTITFSEGSTFAGSGYIKGWGIEAPIDDKMQNTFTYKISGKPTFTPAA